jgi:hypothetical protein
MRCALLQAESRYQGTNVTLNDLATAPEGEPFFAVFAGANAGERVCALPISLGNVVVATRQPSLMRALQCDGTGAKIMLPLTQSLYVPGMISDSNKVLVDIGTGYYAEKTVTKAKEMIDRKASARFHACPVRGRGGVEEGGRSPPPPFDGVSIVVLERDTWWRP